MTTEELIEILKQHPGKKVLKYEGERDEYRDLTSEGITLEQLCWHPIYQSWTDASYVESIKQHLDFDKDYLEGFLPQEEVLVL